MTATPYCQICDRDHAADPGLVLARWRDQAICLDCLEHRPGKEDAEAEAAGRPAPTDVMPAVEIARYAARLLDAAQILDGAWRRGDKPTVTTCLEAIALYATIIKTDLFPCVGD